MEIKPILVIGLFSLSLFASSDNDTVYIETQKRDSLTSTSNEAGILEAVTNEGKENNQKAKSRYLDSMSNEKYRMASRNQWFVLGTIGITITAILIMTFLLYPHSLAGTR
jgi:hypothetical protein